MTAGLFIQTQSRLIYPVDFQAAWAVFVQPPLLPKSATNRQQKPTLRKRLPHPDLGLLRLALGCWRTWPTSLPESRIALRLRSRAGGLNLPRTAPGAGLNLNPAVAFTGG